jgi:hypothetical protein
MPAKARTRSARPQTTPPTRRTTPQQESDAAGGADKYAPSAWGSSSIGNVEDLLCPSGQLCAARRPGVEGMMKAGILNNVDALSALVQSEHIQRVEGGAATRDERDVAATLKNLLSEPNKFNEMVHMVDRVVCHVVVHPELHMTPNDPTSREPGFIYCDMVDLEDKMFIFNFAVGGTRDIETFRKERDSAMGSLEPVKDIGHTA